MFRIAVTETQKLKKTIKIIYIKFNCYIINMLLYALGICAIIVALRYYYESSRPQNSKVAPLLGGGHFIAGHTFQLLRDPLKFMLLAKAKHGDVFRIRLFWRKITVFANRSFVSEYFRTKEEELSLFKISKQLYYIDAFTDDDIIVSNEVDIIKKIIGVDHELFLGKIIVGAKEMVKDLGEQIGLDSQQIICRQITKTAGKCFLDLELSDEFLDCFDHFNKLLNKIVTLAYVVPAWLMRLTLGRKLNQYRNLMVKLLVPHIESYRGDRSKGQCTLFRRAVDQNFNGEFLSNERIANLSLMIMFGASVNSSIGLNNLVLDLCRHPAIWEKVSHESKTHLANGDIKSLLGSSIIDAVLLESAKLNNHIFTFNRQPMSKQAVFSGYYIGDQHMVVLGLTMFDSDPCTNAELKFNPEFREGGNNICWGYRSRLCPGVNFAKNHLKIAIAFITANFDVHHYGRITYDYKNSVSFCEQKSKVILKRK